MMGRLTIYQEMSAPSTSNGDMHDLSWYFIDGLGLASLGAYCICLRPSFQCKLWKDVLSCCNANMLEKMTGSFYPLISIQFGMALYVYGSPLKHGYWKFNMSLLDMKDFWEQLLLTINWELSGAMFENKWWDHLKITFRSFVANYSRQLNLDGQTTQKALESRIEPIVKSWASNKVVIAKDELDHFA